MHIRISERGQRFVRNIRASKIADDVEAGDVAGLCSSADPRIYLEALLHVCLGLHLA